VAGLWGGMRGYLAYRTQNSRPQGGGP
jgi:hypothetical protein